MNKVDRSVGGLKLYSNNEGPYQLPLSNYSLVKNEFNSEFGLSFRTGEKPIDFI